MLRLCCKMDSINAIPPSKSKNISDAGHDIFTPYEFVLPVGQSITIDTGLILWYEPVGNVLSTVWDSLSWYPRLAPKSGLASKKTIAVLGGVGDRSYCGPEDVMKVILMNLGMNDLIMDAGEAICQIIPEAIWTCDNMTAEVRTSTPLTASRGGLTSGS